MRRNNDDGLLTTVSHGGGGGSPLQTRPCVDDKAPCASGTAPAESTGSGDVAPSETTDAFVQPHATAAPSNGDTDREAHVVATSPGGSRDGGHAQVLQESPELSVQPAPSASPSPSAQLGASDHRVTPEGQGKGGPLCEPDTGGRRHDETSPRSAAVADGEDDAQLHGADLQPASIADCQAERSAAAHPCRRVTDRAGFARWRRVVDATQTISVDMPVWPGDPAPFFEDVATFTDEGYRLRSVRLGEHSGTHVNAPSAFFPGGAGLDEAARWPLIAPLVVLDVRQQAMLDAGYRCTPDDVVAWEARFGRIPVDSFVACNTGWHRLWNEPSRYLGLDAPEGLMFPSFSPAAVIMLCNERRVGGIGIDTHGVDAPDDVGFTCNRLALERGCVVVECLGSLDVVPASGALVIISPLPLRGGTGAPVTVTVLVS